LAIEDVPDGRVHVVRTPGDLELWLKSFKTGECVQPAFGICGRCNAIHSDKDVGGEVFGKCIRCQAELVEVALEHRDEQEAE
jgi:hypothetical protein